MYIYSSHHIVLFFSSSKKVQAAHKLFILRSSSFLDLTTVISIEYNLRSNLYLNLNFIFSVKQSQSHTGTLLISSRSFHVFTEVKSSLERILLTDDRSAVRIFSIDIFFSGLEGNDSYANSQHTISIYIAAR